MLDLALRVTLAGMLAYRIAHDFHVASHAPWLCDETCPRWLRA